MRLLGLSELMCASIIGFLTIGSSGCHKSDAAKERVAVDKPHLSQAELFNLRTECSKLAHKVYDDEEEELRPWSELKNYAWFHSVSLESHYEPASNRCFAELSIETTDRAGTGYDEWSYDLYDAQKNDLIATARHQVSAGSRPVEADSGEIFVYTTGKYNDGYEGAFDFIADHMRETY